MNEFTRFKQKDAAATDASQEAIDNSAPGESDMLTPQEIEALEKEMHMSGRAMRIDETPEEHRAERERSWAEKKQEKLQETRGEIENQAPTLEQQKAQEEREQALKMVSDHFNGKLDLPAQLLNGSEITLLSKMRRLYDEQRVANPDQPVKFQFSNPQDLQTFNNLLSRLPLVVEEHSQTKQDKREADEIREKLGIKKREEGDAKNHNSVEMSSEKDAPFDIDEYLKLPNIEKVFKILKQESEAKWVSSGILANKLYEMLITRSCYEDIKNDLRKYDREILEYEESLAAIQSRISRDGAMNVSTDPRMMGNPGWFRIVTRPEAKGKIKGFSKKRYATIDLNNSPFVKNIDSLAEKLRQIAIDNDDSIEIKFPESFESFAQHNDSIVIHFKKDGSLENINDALEKYLSQSNIEEAEREMERTKVAADSRDTSFSNLVAGKVGKWLEQNHGKYPPELLAKMAIKYVIELSKEQPQIGE